MHVFKKGILCLWYSLCLLALLIFSRRLSFSPSLSCFRFLDRYLKAAEAIKSYLIGYSKPSSLPYLGTKSGSLHGYLQSTMEHLACFYPGLLALGLINDLHPEQRSLAEGLTQACYAAYNSTRSGLAADSFLFNTSPNGKSDYARASVSSDFVLCV